MREIKFRAWNTTTKEWESDFSIEFEDDEVYTDPLPLKLQQYAGLKDKNGKEIYEGDIMALETKGGKNLKVIVWNDTDACFGWTDGNDDSWPDGFTGFYDEYEVIGNIYENPELLREKLLE